MKTVWKYPIPAKSPFIHKMPQGASILSVQYQPGVGPCFWALIPDDEAVLDHKETRVFHVYGTGHPISQAVNLTYRGTFQIVDEGLVFHLFESTVEGVGGKP